MITKKADAAKPKAVVKKTEAPAHPKKIKAIAHSKAKVVDVKKPNFAKKGHEEKDNEEKASEMAAPAEAEANDAAPEAEPTEAAPAG